MCVCVGGGGGGREVVVCACVGGGGVASTVNLLHVGWNGFVLQLQDHLK